MSGERDISEEELASFPLAAVEDRELVARAQQEDAEAYDELVRRYQPRIYALLYNMTSNREDAEDLLQEVFIKGFQALPNFKGQSSFYTWIYRIGVNRAINFVQKRKRRAALSLDNADLGLERDEAYVDLSGRHTPFRQAKLTELQERLNAALQTLSEKHRAAVVMHDIDGMPHDEIGDILGCSAGTVRSRLFYARQQLQAELSDLMDYERDTPSN